MASLDWQFRRTGEVTLVELSVHSEYDQRVCIESQLRPVWPPRERGVPASGWNGNTFEGIANEGEPLVVGYASPAPPEEPPAEITETGTPAETSAVTPRDLVRTLGEPGPPRDALPGTPESTAPTTDGGGSADAADVALETDVAECYDHGDESCRNGTTFGQGQSATLSVERDTPRAEHQSRPENNQPQDERSAEPTAWLDAVESRVSTTERLARATDADEAREAVDAVGGIEDVRALQAQLDVDRRQLQQVRDRSERLSKQLSAVELPLATLERVV